MKKLFFVSLLGLLSGCTSVCQLQLDVLTQAESVLYEIDLAVEEKDEQYNDSYFLAARSLYIARSLWPRCVEPIGIYGGSVFIRDILVGIGDLLMLMQARGIDAPDSVMQFFDRFEVTVPRRRQRRVINDESSH